MALVSYSPVWQSPCRPSALTSQASSPQNLASMPASSPHRVATGAVEEWLGSEGGPPRDPAVSVHVRDGCVQVDGEQCDPPRAAEVKPARPSSCDSSSVAGGRASVSVQGTSRCASLLRTRYGAVSGGWRAAPWLAVLGAAALPASLVALLGRSLRDVQPDDKVAPYAPHPAVSELPPIHELQLLPFPGEPLPEVAELLSSWLPEQHDASLCSVYPSCAAEGRSGFCCPTADGGEDMLACCRSSHRRPQVSDRFIGGSSPSQPPSPAAPLNAALCRSHPECIKLGLDGACCPTSGEQMLSCCNRTGDGNGGAAQASFSAPLAPEIPPKMSFSAPLAAEFLPKMSGQGAHAYSWAVHATGFAARGLTNGAVPRAMKSADTFEWAASTSGLSAAGPHSSLAPDRFASRAAYAGPAVTMHSAKSLAAEVPTAAPARAQASMLAQRASMNPDSPQPSAGMAPSALCSVYPRCASLGHSGTCCPTSNGMQLDCCS